MSNDVNRFDLVSQFLNYLWVMPIVVPVVTFLVWEHVQWATFAALVVIMLQTVLVQGNFKILNKHMYTMYNTKGRD